MLFRVDFLLVLRMFCCSWFWLYDLMDFGKDKKATPMPKVDAASPEELTEGSGVEEKEDETSKDKKKRTGFRDRKVV